MVQKLDGGRLKLSLTYDLFVKTLCSFLGSGWSRYTLSKASV